MTAVLLGRILVPDFFNPRPEDVDLGFMWWQMRQMRRFSGNRAAPNLMVHHDLCGRLADHIGLSKGSRRWARLHDLHEFAIGDVIRPVKSALGGHEFDRLSDRWDAVIAARLDVPLPTETERLEVALVDDMACGIEWELFLGRQIEDIGFIVPAPPEGWRDIVAAALSGAGMVEQMRSCTPVENAAAYAAAEMAAVQRLRASGVMP